MLKPKISYLELMFPSTITSEITSIHTATVTSMVTTEITTEVEVPHTETLTYSETVEIPITVTATTAIPTTIDGTPTTVVSTIISVTTSLATVSEIATATATAIRTLTQVSLSTITTTIDGRPVTVTNTAVDVVVSYSNKVSTNVQPGQTITVTASGQAETNTAPSTITQLIVCESRTINPTFTPSKPVPTDWTWGCPAGRICQPRQIGCTFERDLPADTYFCSPEECIDASHVPELRHPDGPYNNYTCGLLYKPVEGYFNLNPELFGVDYNIFDQFGQTAEPCATSLSSTTSARHASHATGEVHHYGAAIMEFFNPSHVFPTATINKRSASPKITAPAVLGKREDGETIVPVICYDICNQCGYAAQETGKIYDQLCPTQSNFPRYLGSCRTCIEKNKDDEPVGVPPLLNSLTQWINFCADGPTSTSARSSAIALAQQTGTTTVTGSSNITAVAQRVNASIVESTTRAASGSIAAAQTAEDEERESSTVIPASTSTDTKSAITATSSAGSRPSEQSSASQSNNAGASDDSATSFDDGDDDAEPDSTAQASPSPSAGDFTGTGATVLPSHLFTAAGVLLAAMLLTL